MGVEYRVMKTWNDGPEFGSFFDDPWAPHPVVNRETVCSGGAGGGGGNDWTYYANIARDEENRRNNELRAREAEAEALLQRKQQYLTNIHSSINQSFDNNFTDGFYQNYVNQLMDCWRP